MSSTACARRSREAGQPQDQGCGTFGPVVGLLRGHVWLDQRPRESPEIHRNRAHRAGACAGRRAPVRPAEQDPARRDQLFCHPKRLSRLGAVRRRAVRRHLRQSCADAGVATATRFRFCPDQSRLPDRHSGHLLCVHLAGQSSHQQLDPGPG